MKKLGKIKLNQFSKDELDRRKMNILKGGCDCTNSRLTCSCFGNYTFVFEAMDALSSLRDTAAY